MLLPINLNGRPNADVVKPYVNAVDLVNRPSDTWVIDFGCSMPPEEASLYEAPFEYARSVVHAERQKNRRESYRKYWWRFAEPRPAMRMKLSALNRFIATPLVSKHRIFVWLPVSVLPANLLVAIARSDDTSFGVLHSRFHESWSLRLCTWLGVGNDPRYTPSSTFETFPFPSGLEPNVPAAQYASDPRAVAIADAAECLTRISHQNWFRK